MAGANQSIVRGRGGGVCDAPWALSAELQNARDVLYRLYTFSALTLLVGRTKSH